MTRRIKLGKKGFKPWRYRDERRRKQELDKLIKIQAAEMKYSNLNRRCGD